MLSARPTPADPPPPPPTPTRAATPPALPSPDRTARSSRLLVALVLVVGGGLRLAHLVRSPLALDELEHVHGAFLVSRGQVPYRDFFQHHPPLYYLSLGRLPLFRDPGWSTFLWVRGAALAASAATFVLLWRWARALGGRHVATITAVLLAADYFAARHGTKAFLDTFAAPFAVGALVLAGTRTPTVRRMMGSGACFATALLFTQKVVILAPVLAVALLRAQGGRTRRRVAAGLVAGAALPLALCALALGPRGVSGFVDDALLLNLRWKARHRPTHELAVLLVAGGAVYLLAAAHVVRRFASGWRRPRSVSDGDIPVVALACLLLGAVLIPVVYAEYFVLPVQLAALVAALQLERMLARGPHRHTTAALVAGFGVLIPFVLQATALRDGNGADRERLAFVDTVARPGEPVFDTYSGYGVFHPHAYRYWLLHDELQMMLGDEAMARDIVAALRRVRPPVVLEDRFARTLPDAVKQEVNRDYRQSAVAAVWCRRDRAAVCGQPADARRYGDA